MVNREKIVKAFYVSDIRNVYGRNIEITDLKEDLGTKGHILVIRGDKAYKDQLKGREYLSNPKFWLYENLINSQRVQEQLRQFPNHKLFDGVGFSSLEAIGYHAKQLGRKAVVVMAREMIPDEEVFERWNIEVIHGDEPMEEGYVEKQAEILSKRKDLIHLNQALYGAQTMVPVGNKIVSELENMLVTPDETYWCMASGSNIYGIGAKIKEKFPECKTILVEPSENINIGARLDLNKQDIIKNFARDKLKDYSLSDWDKRYSGVTPLHVSKPNRYILLSWANTGKTGLDKIVEIPNFMVSDTQEILREINEEYDWSKTTALTIVPAIESAKQGKNVLVMAYGKNRPRKLKDLVIVGNHYQQKRHFSRIMVATSIVFVGSIIGAGLTYLMNKYILPDRPPLYVIN